MIKGGEMAVHSSLPSLSGDDGWLHQSSGCGLLISPPPHPHLQAQVGGAPLNGIALIWVAVVYIDCTRAQVKEDPPV